MMRRGMQGDQCAVRWVVAALALASASTGLPVGVGAEHPTTPSDAVSETLSPLAEPAPPEPWLVDWSSVDDPLEQARLRRVFEERWRVLSDGSSVNPSSEAPIVEEVVRRIEQLTIGPQATVEDLRARDAIVATIAGLSDPLARDELLKQLEARERAAD